MPEHVALCRWEPELPTRPQVADREYFRHAVYNFWDPYEDITDEQLTTDRDRLLADDGLAADEFDALRQTEALFRAGEEAVTEDLAPLMLVLEIITDADGEILGIEELVALADRPASAAD